MTSIIIPREHYAEYNMFPALSSNSEYIPIHSLRNREQIFSYSLRFPVAPAIVTRTMDAMNCLNADHPIWLSCSQAAISDGAHKYLFNYGMIIDTVEKPTLRMEPLMLIGVKRHHFMNVSINEPNYDLSKFALIISRRFMDFHSNLYNHVSRSFINIIRNERLMDIVETSNLIDMCYGNEAITIPQFNTINDLLDYTKNINTLLSQEFQDSIYV